MPRSALDRKNREGVIRELQRMIRESGRIVFFGGAGVSTESGIPDFRSENGIYDAIRRFGHAPETLLSHDFFMKETEAFYAYYKSSLLVTDVMPNPAHRALAALENSGKLTAVATQNIDGLHQKGGSRNVYELHGSIHRNYCMKCGKFHDAAYVKAAKTIPYCSACGGLIKPDVVLYGEGLDDNVWEGALKHIMRADMLIVGGTSLVVYPAASLVRYYRGNKLVLINKSETDYDGKADLVIHAPIGEVLDEAVKEDF